MIIPTIILSNDAVMTGAVTGPKMLMAIAALTPILPPAESFRQAPKIRFLVAPISENMPWIDKIILLTGIAEDFLEG